MLHNVLCEPRLACRKAPDLGLMHCMYLGHGVVQGVNLSAVLPTSPCIFRHSVNERVQQDEVRCYKDNTDLSMDI